MMRLYSIPGTSATVATAALEEAGATYEIVPVDRRDRDVPPEFKQVNPHGRVPALSDGDVRLYETAAIILWLGDRFPDSPLLPPLGTPERGDTYRWLTYLTNTVHTAYVRWWSPYFAHIDPDVAQVMKRSAAADLNSAFDFIERELTGRDHLVTSGFTGADLLLHMLASPNWTSDLDPPAFSRPNLAAHHARIDARPAVVRMKQLHGLDWQAPPTA